eukprot:1833593-Lingulodinium_polyedra.AAC.1
MPRAEARPRAAAAAAQRQHRRGSYGVTGRRRRTGTPSTRAGSGRPGLDRSSTGPSARAQPRGRSRR